MSEKSLVKGGVGHVDLLDRCGGEEARGGNDGDGGSLPYLGPDRSKWLRSDDDEIDGSGSNSISPFKVIYLVSGEPLTYCTMSHLR